ALDGGALTGLDTAGALALLRYLQGSDLRSAVPRNFAQHHRRILDVVAGQLSRIRGIEQTRRPGVFEGIGRASAALWRLLAVPIRFLGYIAAGLAPLVTHPRRLRVKELAAQLEQVGIRAIPVVVLVTFLIGLVFAYLLGVQAERYGANIFVVDGVAIGMS